MEFYIWHYWMIAATTFFILEIFTPAFVIFNLGIGALLATIAAALGLSIELQLILFCIGTLISFFAVRPIALKYGYRKSDKRVTNNDALIGRTGVVVTTINNQLNSGEVRVDGDIWRARSINNQIIEIDATVTITKFESITVFVTAENRELEL